MKKILYLLLLSVFISCSGNTPITVKVMTFNVRYDNPGDVLNSWEYRKEVAAAAILENEIDLVGTQEVLANQMEDFRSRLPGYNLIGVGRADGIDKGEYSAIFYNQERFNEINSGTFWLSETPETAGSKGWDGACERIATWAILQEKSTNKKLFFINTHLDHIGKEAREKGVNLLLSRAGLIGKGMPVIITGDFNSAPDSDVYKQVTGNGEFKDSRIIAQDSTDDRGTFHNFGNIPEENRTIIDYIFVSDGINVNSYKVLPDQINDIYISDHNPVLAVLSL